jgi:hypothetical protein
MAINDTNQFMIATALVAMWQNEIAAPASERLEGWLENDGGWWLRFCVKQINNFTDSCNEIAQGQLMLPTIVKHDDAFDWSLPEDSDADVLTAGEAIESGLVWCKANSYNRDNVNILNLEQWEAKGHRRCGYELRFPDGDVTGGRVIVLVVAENIKDLRDGARVELQWDYPWPKTDDDEADRLAGIAAKAAMV